MTITPAATEHELRRLARKLEVKSDALADLLQAAAEADVAYRLAYAKALLRAEGSTVAEREARATLAVEAELTERELTDAVADAVHVLTSGAARRAPCRPVGQRDVHYAAGVELA